MLIKKTKLYLTVGIVLLTNAVTCLVAFFMTYSEKKSLSSAFWAMCITFGAAGAALLALAEHQSGHQLDRTRKRIQDHDHWFQLGIGGSLGGDSPSGVSNVLNPYVTTVVTTKMDTDPSPVGIVLMNHCTTTRTIVDSNGQNRTAIVGIDLVDAIIEMNGKFYLNRRGNDVVTGGDQNQGTQDPSTRSTGHATIGYEAF